MTRSWSSVVLALVLPLSFSLTAAAQSPQQLAIASATPDVVAGTVTLSGANFTDRSDPSPRVWVNRVPVAIQSATATRVVVALPAGLAPGSYLVEMTRTNGRGRDDRGSAKDARDDERGQSKDDDRGRSKDTGKDDRGGSDDDRASANGPRYGAITLTIGAVGATGAQGPQGLPGAQGFTGAQGAQGPQGPAGPQGAPGAQGPAGSAGASGPVGPAGPAGAVGAVGPTGAQGAPGLNGLNGAQGQQGQRGPGGVRGFAEFPYPGEHRFTVPNDVTAILVELWGAGGGGGGASAIIAGGGGGGGAYAKAVLPVSAGQVFAVFVGWGGNSGGGSDVCFPGYPALSGYVGGYSAIVDAAGRFLSADGGQGGGGGDWVAGHGGAGADFRNTFTDTRGLLARGGYRGTAGGSLGLAVPGGRTPSGSVALPFGLGGGEAGFMSCSNGQTGAPGMVIVSW